MAEKALKQPDVFIWTGTDKRGVRVKGQTRGSNPNLIRADLRKQGITPIKVKKQTQLFSGQKKTITAKDIAVFFRQLATMMAAGVPLVQSFEIIGRGHENASMRELVLKIKNEVESGTSLSRSMTRIACEPSLRDELVQRGLRNAARFRWESTMDSLVGVYRKAVSGSSALNGITASPEATLAS